MAIGTPALATANVGATGTSAASASFTPTEGDVLIAFLSARTSGASVPTISDSIGSTWIQFPEAGLEQGHIQANLYYQVVPASPAARTVTVSCVGANQVGMSIFNISGADTDWSNFHFTQAATSDVTVNMDAFAANSACMGFITTNAGANYASPSGYTEIFDSDLATNLRQSACYDLTSPGNALTWDSNVVDTIAYGLEIKEPTAAGAISGSASITEAGDTVAGSAALRIAGAATLSEENDALTATGAVVPGIAGALSVTEEADTAAATAAIALRASLAAAEGSDSVSASSRVNLAAAASLSESGDTLSIAGKVATQGAASITEEADSLSAAATIVLASRAGSADITEAGDTLASANALALKASASIAEAGDTLATAAGPLVKGVAAIAEAGDIITARAVPILVSSPHERSAAVPAENRTAAVVAETRTASVKAEVRTASARAETRRAAA